MLAALWMLACQGPGENLGESADPSETGAESAIGPDSAGDSADSSEDSAPDDSAAPEDSALDSAEDDDSAEDSAEPLPDDPRAGRYVLSATEASDSCGMVLLPRPFSLDGPTGEMVARLDTYDSLYGLFPAADAPCEATASGLRCAHSVSRTYNLETGGFTDTRTHTVELAFLPDESAQFTERYAVSCVGTGCAGRVTPCERVLLGAARRPPPPPICTPEPLPTYSAGNAHAITAKLLNQPASFYFNFLPASAELHDVAWPGGAAGIPGSAPNTLVGLVGAGPFGLRGDRNDPLDDFFPAWRAGYATGAAEVDMRFFRRAIWTQYLTTGGNDGPSPDHGQLEVQAFGPSGFLTGATVQVDAPYAAATNLVPVDGQPILRPQTAAPTTGGGNVIFHNVCPGSATVRVRSAGGAECRPNPAAPGTPVTHLEAPIEAGAFTLVRFDCP